MPEIVSPLPKGTIQPRSLCSFNSAKEMFDFVFAHVAQFRLGEYNECTRNMRDQTHMRVFETDFLREYVWCVYVAGFSAKVISDKFKSLLDVHKIRDRYFGDIFKCKPETMLSEDEMDRVYGVFKNKNKAKAVQSVRRMISDMGWDEFHEKYVRGLDPKKLEELPGLGPALACHLARNLGNIKVCKPDVHLKRLAEKYKFESVQKMCETLNPNVPAGFVDLMLWLACIDHGTKDGT